jgi:hypothetical protein
VLPACVSVAGMIAIHKKIVVDEPSPLLQKAGLGLDLDKRAKADLRATRRDLKRRKTTALKPLSEL